MRFLVALLAAACLLSAQGPDYHGVASAKQIMAGIQKPAMDSLAAMLKAGGPQDEKEWETSQRQAAILAETAQLLLMGNRPLDQDVWVKSSQKLHEASVACAKAAEAKDLAAWKTSLANMGAACKSCHNVHKKQKPQ
jgi:cytochrome c556